jgi:hypothetical protein
MSRIPKRKWCNIFWSGADSEKNNRMKPALAFPFNDPDGTMFHHLLTILPDLKQHFARAYLCPPLSTWAQVDHIRRLEADDFFTLFPPEREMHIGEHFAYLYRRAADAAPPDQIIHLCYLDRMAFALEGEYRDAFLRDIDSLSLDDVPLIFQRSQFAWETHPRNYRELEGLPRLGATSSVKSWIMPGVTLLFALASCVRSCLG